MALPWPPQAASPTTGTSLITRTNGNININGSASGSTLGGPIAVAAVIGVAVDFAAKLIWYRIAPAGNWNGSGTANPATATGGLNITSIATGPLYALFSGGTSDKITSNFGDSAFSGAVPSGFTSGFPVSATIASLAYTEDPDTVAIAVAASNVATLAYTEPADTVAITTANTASLAYTEDADAVAITVAAANAATLAYTEPADTFTITEIAETTASLAYTEDPDTVAITAGMPDAASLAYTEPPDAFAINVGIVPPYWQGPPALWPYRIDFTGPVIYARTMIRVTGPGCIGLRIGDVYFRRRALNYLDNIPDDPAMVIIPCYATELGAVLTVTEPADTIAMAMHQTAEGVALAYREPPDTVTVHA